MRTHMLPLGMPLLILVGCSSSGGESDTDADRPAEPVAVVSAGNMRISGPYSHENLDVFLIHGEERVFAHDVVIPPYSGRTPISSFCVERGRWRRRGDESMARFSLSEAYLTSKELREAVGGFSSQALVWDRVEALQDELQTACGTSLADERSPSSLPLTLEHEELQEALGQYVEPLARLLGENQDALGFAFAVNGELASADVYASHTLFAMLWPKLLRASATEALSKRREDARAGAVRPPESRNGVSGSGLVAATLEAREGGNRCAVGVAVCPVTVSLSSAGATTAQEAVEVCSAP